MRTRYLGRTNIGTIIIALCLLIVIGGCQTEKKQMPLSSERGNLSWDYSGKLASVINKDSLSHNDSLSVISYLYQAAAMDSRLYELQSKLTTAYFWGCHDQCIKRRCTSGDIAAAAVDYLLRGQTDSAMFVIGWIDREIVGKAPEIREISNITGFIADRKFETDWPRPYRDGLIKTPAGTALWAVVSIDAGANPKSWIALLTSALKTSNAPSLKYALAYALMKSGNPLIAWQTMPVFVPGTNQFAPPDFEQELVRRDSSSMSPIYLNLNQYIISKVEQIFLRNILRSNSSISYDSIAKVVTLARLKGLSISIDFDKPVAETDYTEQIKLAKSLANDSEFTLEASLAKLINPLARSIFLYLETSAQIKNKAPIKELIFSQIEAEKSTNEWESKILLTLALENIMAPSEVLSRIGPFIPQDTSLANYSPEWLAIYAEYCIGDNTKSERLTRIGEELKKAYPYASGIEELIEKIKQICNQ